ncbi:protealysin inhibitor emfourin [Arthrobacter sp. 92]|jgi:hypothetical protein|uniref:protealysin inhibitor emfourin n=1 Tax=Arthrobacter sp. 92 TaxID=3418175 RepID=UPI0006A91DDE|nr:conserved hypothetical protein [Arthrobacter sp. Hiyo6]
MKLTIRRGGGIAGIVRRTELDDKDLSSEDADAFAREVDRARMRELEKPDIPHHLPDAQLYETVLEDADNQIRLNYTDETLPEDVRQLIQWVDNRPESQESIEL